VINGDFTQTIAGLLDIDIGGVVPGIEHDQLQISGRATLDGTLNLMLLPGFTANANDSFRIMTWGSRTGEFAAINGVELGGGMYFVPMYEGGGLDLWAIQT
jgi:hypothetical protein